MADAIIDIVGEGDLPVLVKLYNQVFRPPRDLEHFQRRYMGRHNVLQMIARLGDRPVGFMLGFELKPRVFFVWFLGVLAPVRRQGIGSQLMEALHSWARQNDYEAVRFECHNQHRPLLLLALGHGYDIIGIRWDTDREENLILLQKSVGGDR
jgi:GNAT superfamily N-acetyltransferase